MKRQASETNAAAVARAFVDKTLEDIFERQRNYKIKLILDREIGPRSSSQIIFVNLSLLNQVKHRFTLILEKISGQWMVVTASFNSFTSTGSAIQETIRRLEVRHPKVKRVKKVKAKAPAPTPAETKTSPTLAIAEKDKGLVYAKVTRICDDKTLVVEHALGKRMVTIEEDQPFYGTTTHLGRPRVGMTPIRLGDTIAYRPDKSSAGNHIFVGLPTKE